MRNGKKPPKMP